MNLKTDYSKLDLCWFAGWWDAEGCIQNNHVNGRTYLHIMGTSTDEDVVRKIQSKFGGNIRGPYHSATVTGKRAKPRWDWCISKTREAEILALAIRPLVCSRRQAQIDAKILAISMAQADDEA